MLRLRQYTEAILCHVRVVSAIFWGADKRSVGEPDLVVFARISISSTFLVALQLAHVLHGSGAHFMTAGSHKTHCHGIAAEIAFSFGWVKHSDAHIS